NTGPFGEHAPTRAPRRTETLQTAIVAGCLLFIYSQALMQYLREQYFQEHFIYLWGFLALALSRSLRRPFRSRFALTNGRDQLGLGLVASAIALLAFSQMAGTSAGTRTSLVAFVT